jgi:putative endonuclease
MNKRLIGGEYERLAAEYLKKKGMFILEMNFRNRGGEIDIIAKDGEYICFIEVKYRTTNEWGFPLEAVHYRKQQQIRNTEF